VILAGVLDEVERDAVVEPKYCEGAVRGRLGETKHTSNLAGGAPGVLGVNRVWLNSMLKNAPSS
jgi:hypothetical protein